MKHDDYYKLSASVVLCLAAGAVGSVFTVKAIPTWYAGLVKPSFSPPNYVFGPVWTTLYMLMGVSLFLVWKREIGAPGVKSAITLFIIQLAVNAFWPLLFFSLRSPAAGMADIVILDILVAATIVQFLKISKCAGALLIPYILWILYASALNFAVWRLNG